MRDQVRNLEQQVENERRSNEAVMLSVQVLNEDRQQSRAELEAIRADFRRREAADQAEHRMDLESLDSLSRLIEQLPAERKSSQHSEAALPGVDEQPDE